MRLLFLLISIALLLPGFGAAREKQTAGQETPAAGAGEETAPAETGSLGLIESYYREGQAFRAETELLRLLHERPRHPRRSEVELVRAKLFYREGRFKESSLMLFSQLDRFPRGRAAPQARRLLAFSLIREGRLEEARGFLEAGGGRPDSPPAVPRLDLLQGPPPGAVSPDSAVAWSTWLPGTGFFLLDQPGNAFAAMGLNLFFIGAAVASFEADLPGAGLVFLLAELAIYRGGRDAVRDAAEQQIARLRRERMESWLQARGEPELLRVAFRLPFGAE